MPKYVVNWHIKRKGKMIEPGTADKPATIELSEEDAAPLLKDGCITDPNAKPAADEAAPQTKAAAKKVITADNKKT